mmetsp:Transcript_3249/g.10121  ORF Transcript_3249/g.10121 Transcript_3249/m.10121 type:complete len:231 (+) Transcript_3249:102-794(+)
MAPPETRSRLTSHPERGHAAVAAELLTLAFLPSSPPSPPPSPAVTASRAAAEAATAAAARAVISPSLARSHPSNTPAVALLCGANQDAEARPPPPPPAKSPPSRSQSRCHGDGLPATDTPGAPVAASRSACSCRRSAAVSARAPRTIVGAVSSTSASRDSSSAAGWCSLESAARRAACSCAGSSAGSSKPRAPQKPVRFGGGGAAAALVTQTGGRSSMPTSERIQRSSLR